MAMLSMSFLSVVCKEPHLQHANLETSEMTIPQAASGCADLATLRMRIFDVICKEPQSFNTLT